MAASTSTTAFLRQLRRIVVAQCPSPLADDELLRQFIGERDEMAFAMLVRRHGSMVLGVSRNVLHHQQDAEDVFQATFLLLARKAETIRKHQSLSSWLHGVAYRLALKTRTQKGRRQEREQSAAAGRVAEHRDDLTVRELRVILHEELHRLPEKYRAPLLLCYWEGKTRDEAAARLGMTPDMLKKRLERARSLLGSRLTRRGLAPTVGLFTWLISESGTQAAVSSLLIQNTAQAAVAFAAAQPVAVGASTAAVTLAQGAIRTMFLTKCFTTLLAFVAVIGVGTLTFAGYSALAGKQADAGRIVVLQAQPKPKAVAQPAKKTDAERIVGTWKTVNAVTEGKSAFPPEVLAAGRFIFQKDGKMNFTVGKHSETSTYKIIDPGKFDAPGSLGIGIYQFDGDDRLTLCYRPGNDPAKRPTEFSAEKGAVRVLITLEREVAQPPKTDAERIVGTWRFTKYVMNGKEMGANFYTLARMTITKDGMSMTVGFGPGGISKYKLVAPGKIDMIGPLAFGIYKFDGDDQITICGHEGPIQGERPTEFTAEKGSGRNLFILQRSKPLTPDEIALQAQPAKKTDAERIVGTWRVVKGTNNGKAMPAEVRTYMRMTFGKDGSLNVTVAGEPRKKDGTYKLVGAGKIDLPPSLHGLYKFDGDDRLTMCIYEGPVKGRRPADFSAEANSGQSVVFMERSKPLTPDEVAKANAVLKNLGGDAAHQISVNNLRQIALAMHNYDAAYKGFPAHAICSKDGKTALLSWRVAILPFIGQHVLYNEFKLDKPWDSVHNKKLIAKMPKIYADVRADAKNDGKTYYQVFTGPGTAFEGSKKKTPAEFTAGTSKTALGAEAKDAVIWTQPIDIVVPAEKGKMPALGGLFPDGYHVMMADGSVRFVPRDTTPAAVRALVIPME